MFMMLTVRTLRGGTSGVPKSTKALIFDAKWWHQADSEEQQGFIYGYLDCHQLKHVPNVSIVDEQNFVSTAVDKQASDNRNAVIAAIDLSLITLKSRNSLKGGEVFAGPHGFLDGEWWGGFDGGRPWPPNVADRDRGYLEGYLQCAESQVSTQAVHHYQLALNNHYTLARHAHDKIANVLQKLLKPPAPSVSFRK